METHELFKQALQVLGHENPEAIGQFDEPGRKWLVALMQALVENSEALAKQHEIAMMGVDRYARTLEAKIDSTDAVMKDAFLAPSRSRAARRLTSLLEALSY